jgi:hypothetical protein
MATIRATPTKKKPKARNSKAANASGAMRRTATRPRRPVVRIPNLASSPNGAALSEWNAPTAWKVASRPVVSPSCDQSADQGAAEIQQIMRPAHPRCNPALAVMGRKKLGMLAEPSWCSNAGMPIGSATGWRA